MLDLALITGRGGLGDAIYARPFVREAARLHDVVLVETSWPEIFADLPVRPVKRMGGLATQAHHGEAHPPQTWAARPAEAPDMVRLTPPAHSFGTFRHISLRYRWSQLARRVSIWSEMERLSGLGPALVLDLPPLPEPAIDGPYAVVRPPAIRVDFPAPSREPSPEYLRTAAEMLQARGIRVVSIGAFIPGLEEPNGTIPADVRFEHGELPLMQAVALVAHASVVVSGPCWLVPACAASQAPLVVIAGGCGGRNNPDALVDRRLHTGIRWLLPSQYCMCRKRDHACPKDIPRFEAKMGDAFDAVLLAKAVA